MNVHLLHIPSAFLVPWQVHAVESCRDPFSGKAETYLAGFGEEETARLYAGMQGYRIVNEANDAGRDARKEAAA